MPDDGRAAAAQTPAQAPLTIDEIVRLCAVNSTFFSQEFFPETVRQSPPAFHADIWQKLESNARLVNLLVFRGGAKTSLLRIYTAKRIALGIARTILYIGKSEPHAIRSLKWIRRAVQYNTKFSTVFGLEPGNSWADLECEIKHKVYGHSVWLNAAGITGSIRGLNQDDYRPDLIILDDVLTEQNAATEDQREKSEDLIYSAVVQSLAPASEMPDAKVVMLQTPFHLDDASVKALKDPAWLCARYGVWTPESENLPTHQQQSAWPERWSDEELRKEKAGYVARNQLHLWLREKECKVTSPATSAFREEWLQYYDLPPKTRNIVMVIDPVPPPSDVQIAKGLKGKDYEAFAVVGEHEGDYFLLDYKIERGHDPNWTIATFFSLGLKWRPRKVMVEAVAYQRTLVFLLEQAMQAQRTYFPVEEYVDKRSKYDRIVDCLNGPASARRFYVKREHTDLISQFITYPDVKHDDLLEAVAVGVGNLDKFAIFDASDDYEKDERSYGPAPMMAHAP